MTKERRAEALKYIEAQLDNGYIDLGINDQDEFEIIKEAINMWRAVDEFNSVGCTSFRLTADELKEIVEKEYGAN